MAKSSAAFGFAVSPHAIYSTIMINNYINNSDDDNDDDNAHLMMMMMIIIIMVIIIIIIINNNNILCRKTVGKKRPISWEFARQILLEIEQF